MNRFARIALVASCVFVACKKNEPAATGGPSTAGQEAPPAAAPEPAPPAKPAPAAPVAPVSIEHALRFVPTEAFVVAQINAKAFMASPIFEPAKNAAKSDPANARWILALAKCGLSFDALLGQPGPSLITIASAGEAQTSAALEFSNIGKKDFVQCLFQAMAEGGQAPVPKLVERDGHTVIEAEDTYAFLVPDDAIVGASDGWRATIQNVLFDNGPTAVKGPLAELLGSVDRTQMAWIALQATSMPATARASLPPGLQTATATIDLSKGFGTVAKLTFENAAQATQARQNFQQGWDQVKPMAAGFGIPASAVSKLKFEGTDTTVLVTLDLTADELNQIATTVSRMTAQAAQAAEAAPPPAVTPPAAPGKNAKPAAVKKPPAAPAPTKP